MPASPRPEFTVATVRSHAFGYKQVCLDSAPFIKAAHRIYEDNGLWIARITRVSKLRPSFMIVGDSWNERCDLGETWYVACHSDTRCWLMGARRTLEIAH